MSWPGLAAITLLGWAILPAPARAQRLHVYGPPGDGTGRRLLVVVEDRAGGCAAWDAIELRVLEDGAALTPSDIVSPCARWVEVRAPGGVASLEASIDGERATATVPLGVAARLDLEVVRTGDEVSVRCRSTPCDAPSGEVLWAEGRVALVARGEDLVAVVPPDGLLGVLVRDGERFGAAAVPAGAALHEEVLVSVLSLSAGGTARPAAVLFVTDDHGAMSRAVPLQITSETARLDRLVWTAPGVAEVWMSASADAPNVALAIASPSLTREVTIPVDGAAPVHATLSAGARVGPAIEVEVHASGLDGSPVPPEALRVRCGDADVEVSAMHTALCMLAPGAGRALVALARVGEVLVPVGGTTIDVEAPAPPPPASPAPPPLPAAEAATVHLSGLAIAAVSLWGAPSLGAGVSARVPLDPSVHIDVGLRYLATLVRFAGQGLVTDALAGVEHATELAGIARFSPVAPWLDLLVGLTSAVVAVDATVGERPVRWARLEGALAAGVGTNVVIERASLGADLLVRFVTPLHEVPFDAAWLRVSLEVRGGFDVP